MVVDAATGPTTHEVDASAASGSVNVHPAALTVGSVTLIDSSDTFPVLVTVKR